MPDKGAGTEQRAVEFAEAKSGLQFRAGHPVVLIISDVQGTPRRVRDGEAADGGPPKPSPDSAGKEGAGAPPGNKIIQGTFRVGAHIVKAATFRLHKGKGDGPLLTPKELEGGKTALRWAGDHWVTGDDGKYRFTDLPEERYFVELIGKPEDEE